MRSIETKTVRSLCVTPPVFSYCAQVNISLSRVWITGETDSIPYLLHVAADEMEK